MCTHTCVCIELSFSIMVLRWSFELEMYLGSGEGSSLDSATGVEFYCSCSSKYYTFENNTLILHCKNHYVFGPHSQVNKADAPAFTPLDSPTCSHPSIPGAQAMLPMRSMPHPQSRFQGVEKRPQWGHLLFPRLSSLISQHVQGGEWSLPLDQMLQ